MHPIGRGEPFPHSMARFICQFASTDKKIMHFFLSFRAPLPESGQARCSCGSEKRKWRKKANTRPALAFALTAPQSFHQPFQARKIEAGNDARWRGLFFSRRARPLPRPAPQDGGGGSPSCRAADRQPVGRVTPPPFPSGHAPLTRPLRVQPRRGPSYGRAGLRPRRFFHAKQPCIAVAGP
jgi:hypothetical protein